MSTSKQALSNGKKAVIALIIMALVVAATMLFFKNKQDSATDTKFAFDTSPRVVNVDINGTDYGSVEAGTELTVAATSKADIKVTQEGFEAYTGTVEIDPGATNQIHVALIPETDEAWVTIGEEEDLQQEKDVTEEYLNTAEEAYKDFPILKELPHKANLFSAYQGLPKNAGYEFGLHLHLYKGQEDKGREEFKKWMTAQNYDPADYDVVETVKDDAPLVAFAEPPTMRQLEKLTAKDIEIPVKPSPRDLSADQVAQLFALTTTTWDTVKDNHNSAAFIRASTLMTKIQAGLTQAPEKPITSPSWRTAAQTQSRSKSWITEYTSDKQKGGTTKANVEVCWAWIGDDRELKVDGPRIYELTITNGDPAISKYTYKDPDPFVDNSETRCLPEDS